MIEGLRIRRVIDGDAVNWIHVLDALVKNFSLSFRQADKLVRQFRRKFFSPLNIEWFLGSKLSNSENIVSASICETLGADQVVLTFNKAYTFAACHFKFEQLIELTPDMHRDLSHTMNGHKKALMAVIIFGRRIEITSLLRLILIQSGIIVGAILSYVVLMLMLLYTISVILLFVMDPVEITNVAVNHGSFGLALLSFFVLAAAVCGRAIKNVLRLVRVA